MTPTPAAVGELDCLAAQMLLDAQAAWLHAADTGVILASFRFAAVRLVAPAALIGSSRQRR